MLDSTLQGGVLRDSVRNHIRITSACKCRTDDKMRFEDWDVLLFPGGTHDSHVPLREYRVECHAVEDELNANGKDTTGKLGW